MAAAGKDAEPRRQLLHQIEHRDEEEDERQQAVAPERPALCGGDDVAGVGVGQHDQEPRAPHCSGANKGNRTEAVRARYVIS